MSFNNIIDKIPQKIHAQTKTFMTNEIAIFRPEKYIIGQKIRMEDYHFIIFHSTPPPAMIGSREFQFKKGSLISLEPKTEITVYPNEHNQLCQYISICVNKSFMEKVALEALGSQLVKFDRIENTYSRQLLDTIGSFEYELSNFGNKYPIMIQSLSTQIAFLLLRDSLPDSIGHNAIGNNEDDYLIRAIEYMRTYYSSSITIEDICQEIYLSPSHFKRIFKNKTGISPYRFLVNLRIEKVKQILTKESYPMDEAARLCGFANSGHLSTVFKRSQGISPSEYRKQFQAIHIKDAQ